MEEMHPLTRNLVNKVDPPFQWCQISWSGSSASNEVWVPLEDISSMEGVIFQSNISALLNSSVEWKVTLSCNFPLCRDANRIILLPATCIHVTCRSLISLGAVSASFVRSVVSERTGETDTEHTYRWMHYLCFHGEPRELFTKGSDHVKQNETNMWNTMQRQWNKTFLLFLQNCSGLA